MPAFIIAQIEYQFTVDREETGQVRLNVRKFIHSFTSTDSFSFAGMRRYLEIIQRQL
jgi:hypothetical protein